MNFQQAVNECLAGKKVRHKNWATSSILYYNKDKNKISFVGGTDIGIILPEQLASNDFEVVKETVKLSSIPIGKQFKWNNYTFIRVSNYGASRYIYNYIDSTNYSLHGSDKDLEVCPVKG